ncbi:hypothetical protein RJ53_05480 [Methanocalculus chunghsingensis]|uniref:Uncharacterized protein n=1 Tax=Methanocalculus chunghsingensis TaxID=156457 RepID=A0A8J8B6T0_9EURY|nr:DEAD/DEAH box helicase [Methanocalculus chunghsingensis]MBR1368982.1 hypothetical protein [Methanocalculus chunghsingensis]
MIILHGFWTPDSPGTIRVWGEDTAAPREGEKRRGRRPKIPPVRPHPFAADMESLCRTIPGTGYPSGESAEAETGSATILLPSSGSSPLPSPECGGGPEGSAILAPFTVPLLSLPLSLPDLAHLPSHLPVGRTLRFWSAAARYAADLAINGFFLPGPDGWEAALPDMDQLDALRRTFPPACRIWAGDGMDDAILITSFLNHAVHEIVSSGIGDRPLLPPKRGRKRSIPLPEEAWVVHLSGAPVSLLDEADEDELFRRTVREWINSGSLHSKTHKDDDILRGCFLLEDPDPGKRRWKLTFNLAGSETSSRLIPAEDIWNGNVTTPSGDDPADILLTELGMAARIYPELKAGLKTARPTALPLDTDGAYTFLTHAAPLLIDAGYSVILPAWWKKTGSRPSLKVSVTKTESEGRFGLRSLASYSWKVAVGDTELTPEEFDELIQQKIPLIRMHGQWVSIDESGIEMAKRAFEKRFGTMTVGELLRLSSGADPDLPLAEIVDTDGWMGWLLSEKGEMAPVPVPSSFRGTLRPYQEEGIAWLSYLTRNGIGACLADDMGLGKTIQIIAYLLAWEEEVLPALIICPTSLVGNWRREIQRFAPDLSIITHHGSSRDTALLGDADVTITTYPLVVRDLEEIRSRSWKAIIIDEAQNIKNPQAKQSRAVRSLKADHAIALTGTPVENRLTELWSIMEFLNPGYLGSLRAFKEQYAAPIERFNDPERTRQLRTLIRPFVMRRMKTDKAIISDLPEKMEMKVYCTLTPEQASLYEGVVLELLGMVKGRDGIERKGLVLSALMKLKQICNHPALFQQDTMASPDRSGKCTRLLEMLEEVLDAGERALIFTQFPSFGERLIDLITERCNVPVLFLHGGTPQKERDAMVQRFQGEGGPPIFLLSLKAGGTGLNLTAANHVFHLDRWWNPAVENQATDRAFRIGQTRDVQVRTMITGGTLEEQIDEVIEGKKKLAGSILSGGEDWIASLSDDELRDLLTLRTEAFS